MPVKRKKTRESDAATSSTNPGDALARSADRARRSFGRSEQQLSGSTRVRSAACLLAARKSQIGRWFRSADLAGRTFGPDYAELRSGTGSSKPVDS